MAKAYSDQSDIGLGIVQNEMAIPIVRSTLTLKLCLCKLMLGALKALQQWRYQLTP